MIASLWSCWNAVWKVMQPIYHLSKNINSHTHSLPFRVAKQLTNMFFLMFWVMVKKEGLPVYAKGEKVQTLTTGSLQCNNKTGF